MNGERPLAMRPVRDEHVTPPNWSALSSQEEALYFLPRRETLEDCLAGAASATCPHMEPENKANTQRQVEPVQEMEGGDKVLITLFESSHA